MFIEKVKAVVIGHAVGDALGVPVEFSSRQELDINPVTDMKGYGVHPVPRGAWSDDTSMALACMDSLSNGIDYDDMMLKFCKWMVEAKYTPTEVVFDMGITTVIALKKYLSKQAPALQCGQDGEFDNGNGSLMRIHPIVLYLYNKDLKVDKKIEIIHNVSALTHAHERSKIGCGIYAFILWRLLKNPSKNTVIESLQTAKEFYKNNTESGYYNRLFDENFAKTKRELIKSSGYIVDTLEAVIWCLLNTDTYKDCVLKAVNLGSDTDTVGAIAGGLAGALYGYESIPEDWKDALIKREYIESLCEKMI